MILAFDFETTGMLDKGLPLDHESQPRIMQIGAVLAEDDGTTVSEIRDLYIRPADTKVKPGAETVHGITNQMANRYGVSEIAGLGLLVGLSANARICVGHGVAFDRDVAVSLLKRLGKSTELLRRPRLQWCCTKQAMTEICAIPSQHIDGAAKWPTLSEAYQWAFNREPGGKAHSAYADARAALDLYLWLVSMGYQADE